MKKLWIFILILVLIFPAGAKAADDNSESQESAPPVESAQPEESPSAATEEESSDRPPEPTNPEDEPTDEPDNPEDEPTDEPDDLVDEPTDEPDDLVDGPTDEPDNPEDEPTDEPDNPEDEPTDEPDDLVDEPTEEPIGSEETDTDPTTNAEATATEAPILAEPSEIINVIVPTNLDFTIDPLEFSNQGQVYSETFAVENLSDKDVLLTFTGLNVTFANDTDFDLRTQPFEALEQALIGNTQKSIYLALDFGRDDVQPVVLTGDNEPVSAVLYAAKPGEAPESSRLQLSLSGHANPYSAVPWVSGDVKISLTYQIDVLSQSETETIQTLTEEEAVALPQEVTPTEEPENTTEIEQDQI